MFFAGVCVCVCARVSFVWGGELVELALAKYKDDQKHKRNPIF